MTNLEDMQNTVAALEQLNDEMTKANDELEVINKEEGLFQWQISAYPQLQLMFQAKEPYAKLWTTALEFTVKNEQWMNGD
jgi:dynein heavy chain